jgi:hypothetical protein
MEERIAAAGRARAGGGGGAGGTGAARGGRAAGARAPLRLARAGDGACRLRPGRAPGLPATSPGPRAVRGRRRAHRGGGRAPDGVPLGVWSVSLEDFRPACRTPMLVDAIDDAARCGRQAVPPPPAELAPADARSAPGGSWSAWTRGAPRCVNGCGAATRRGRAACATTSSVSAPRSSCSPGETRPRRADAVRHALRAPPPAPLEPRRAPRSRLGRALLPPGAPGAGRRDPAPAAPRPPATSSSASPAPARARGLAHAATHLPDRHGFVRG